MGGLLSAISGQFAKAIILGTLFPVIILSALNIFLVAPLLPHPDSLKGQLLKIAVGDDKWGALILTFVLVLLTGLLYNLNIPIIRLFEGYPWANSVIGKWWTGRETRRFSSATTFRSNELWLGPRLALADPDDRLSPDLAEQANDLCLANCNFARYRACHNVTSPRCMLFISKALLILAKHSGGTTTARGIGQTQSGDKRREEQNRRFGKRRKFHFPGL
jgi:hypothetical protein